MGHELESRPRTKLLEEILARVRLGDAAVGRHVQQVEIAPKVMQGRFAVGRAK